LILATGVFSACVKTSKQENKTDSVQENFIECDSIIEVYVGEGHPANDNWYEMVLEREPKFPGGKVALQKFIEENIFYHPLVIEHGARGRVICQFVIERDGSISNIVVVRGIDPLMDKEAINVIQKMPKWIPGELNGETVRVKYTLPITFTH
jgi:TonB family protein